MNLLQDTYLTPPLSLFEDDETRWQAVQSRDPSADGFFVYGVRTTNIFCRPTCKARLARRANVRFYSTGEEALEAGFRACKRCKPEVLGLMPEEAAVQKIRAFVRDRDQEGKEANGVMSLSQMARQTGLSKWHFHRVFKKCVGVTPSEYLKMRRDGGSSDWSLGTGGHDASWMEQQLDVCGFVGPPTCSSAPLLFDDFLIWPDGDDDTLDTLETLPLSL